MIEKNIKSQGCLYLTELIFPSTYVIVPTPSLQLHPKTLDTQAPPLQLPYSPKHCVFHISLDFCHTYTCEFSPNTIFHQKILFYSIVLVLSSKIYCGTIAHDFYLFFDKIVSVFGTIVLWKQFLLNRLWIDLLQIRTGTDWLNSFIKSCKHRLWSCLTSLINVCSTC